jgi:hypothetical protein
MNRFLSTCFLTLLSIWLATPSRAQNRDPVPRLKVTSQISIPSKTNCASLPFVAAGDLCYDSDADLTVGGSAEGAILMYNGTSWERVGRVIVMTEAQLGNVTSCSTGDIAIISDATSGSNLYACVNGSYVAQGGGGGGSGTSTIQEADATVSSNASTLDFGAGFDLTESPSGEVNIVLDFTEDPVNLVNEVTGTLPIASGGTGQVSAAAALAALGGASSGANTSITSLTGLTTPLALGFGGTGLSSATDDTVLTSNGTIWQARTVPNCPAGNQLLYTQASNTWGCEVDGAGGGSGYATIQEDTSALTQRATLNFVGSAITAADDAGNTRTNVTLSQSPSASTSVVGTGRTITGGVGIDTVGDLSADRIISVKSDEQDFITSTTLACGANTEGMVAINSAVLEFCSNEATPTTRRAAYGDTSGNALSGDSATSFFSAGTLEVTRGGTGTTSLGADTRVLFNDGGVVGSDGDLTFNKTTNVLTVAGEVDTQSGCTAGGNDCYDEFKCITGDAAAPTGGFARVYCSGTAGSEVWKVRTATLGVNTLVQTSATQTLTGKTIDGDDNTLQDIPASAIATEVRTIHFNPRLISADATNCTAPAEVTINSGPKVWTINCADNAASVFYGSTSMPDGWNGGTITFELVTVNVNATPSGTLDFDFSAQCRGDSEVISNTWGTAQNAVITYNAQNEMEEATTAAITPAGTCSAGDMLHWRAVMDDTSTNTQVANTYVLAVKMEHTTTVGD